MKLCSQHNHKLPCFAQITSLNEVRVSNLGEEESESLSDFVYYNYIIIVISNQCINIS